jgi:Zn finger protein HypA/HybF involved in hydrogenase expression
MDIMDFGQRSFITWTRESLEAEKEIEMPDPEYICLSCDDTYTYEDELRRCSDCGKLSCPSCGGDVSTIEEHNENAKINAEEKDGT